MLLLVVIAAILHLFFFFSSRRRHTRLQGDWSSDVCSSDLAKRGLNPDIVKEISWMKQEPEWMTKMRLRSLEIFSKKPMPTWGADLSVIDFENIFYYLKASDKQSKTWEDLPPDIKATYDRLGV